MNVLLPLLLAIPLAGALAVALVPMADRTARYVGVAASGGALAVAVAVLAAFDYGDTGTTQLVVDARWLPAIDTRFHLGVDGISLPLVALTALLSLLCALYTLSVLPDPGRPRAFVALLLLLEVGMLGTFVALDLVLFFVFFEIVLIPMYFLIAMWGGPARAPAATKFILFTLLGSGLMLVGFLVVYAQAGTFDMVRLAQAGGDGISHAAQLAAFVLMVVGFGVKTPMWPLHTWLPDAHTEAPTVGSVLLAGVLLKMGTYGLVRVAVPVLPDGAHDVAPYLGALAVVGILYGSLACLAQRDLKRLIAYSSVGHMGFVLLGIATLTPVGLNGALVGNIAHGLITGLLFFLVGGVKDRYHTSDIAELGGGVLAKAPVLGGLTVFAAVASLGLPGLAGFWGEVLALFSAYNPNPALDVGLFRTLMVFGGIGTILTAGYLLWTVQRVNMGVLPERWGQSTLLDTSRGEWVAWAPLVLLIVVLGLVPSLIFGITNDAVAALGQLFGGG